MVHEAARGFDTAAEAYARGRPDYPPEAVDRVAAWLGLRSDRVPGRLLADLGAGTGKLSRLLAARGWRWKVSAAGSR